MAGSVLLVEEPCPPLSRTRNAVLAETNSKYPVNMFCNNKRKSILPDCYTVCVLQCLPILIFVHQCDLSHETQLVLALRLPLCIHYNAAINLRNISMLEGHFLIMQLWKLRWKPSLPGSETLHAFEQCFSAMWPRALGKSIEQYSNSLLPYRNTVCSSEIRCYSTVNTRQNYARIQLTKTSCKSSVRSFVTYKATK